MVLELNSVVCRVHETKQGCYLKRACTMGHQSYDLHAYADLASLRKQRINPDEKYSTNG